MSRLRILTPVKRVLDYALKPRVNRDQTGFDLAGLKMSMNPFCEIAVEESIRIRERTQGLVESITAISIGPTKAQECLRTALALGADRSIHIDVGEMAVEPLVVAKLLQKIVEREKINMVIMGKQAIDNDNGQTGQILAGLLDWAQATQAAKIELKPDDLVEVTCEIDGGQALISAKLPIVITTDLRLNEPRYASLPNIMKAKKKPMESLKPSDLSVDLVQRLELLGVREPPTRKNGEMVQDVDGMISKLKEAGFV